MASPGEETEAGHGVGGVEVTSIMAETALERSFKVIHFSYLVKLEKRKG
jgi:hypothetical protein